MHCKQGYLVRNGADGVTGLAGLVPLAWGGVILRLVVLPLQICQLKGHQPNGS